MQESINHCSKWIMLIHFQFSFNVVFKSSGCLLQIIVQKVTVLLIFYWDSGPNEREITEKDG